MPRFEHYSRVGLACWIVAALSAALPAADEWPQFRGPEGQGHSAAKNLVSTWSETENVLWRTPLPGKAWSSPVISGDEIWMTTALESKATPQEIKDRLKGNTGDQPLTVVSKLVMRALCVDRKSGALKHDIELFTEIDPQPVHALNSFASPTPIIERGKLYCHFGSYGTACLDTATQKVVWTNRTERIKHENGPGSTPVLFGNLLIFHCDGSDVQYIVALNAETGKRAWKTPRSGKLHANPQEKKAYGTPLLVEVGGKHQLLSPAADWLYSYDPTSGDELWKVSYGVLGYSIVPRPVVGHGLAYVCTSFNQSECLAIRIDGKGDEAGPHIAWRFAKQMPSMPSPLLVGKELYLIGDRGVATCLDAVSGEVAWTQRLPGNYCASPLLADGKIYFCSREGVTTVIKPGRSYEKVAENKLDGQLMASPIALDSVLYLRTDKAIYAIGKK